MSRPDLYITFEGSSPGVVVGVTDRASWSSAELGNYNSAVAFALNCPVTGPLNTVWFGVDSFTGSGTDGMITFEVREGMRQSYVPGDLLIVSRSIILGTTPLGLRRYDVVNPPTLTAGKMYCFVFRGPTVSGYRVARLMTRSIEHFPPPRCGSWAFALVRTLGGFGSSNSLVHGEVYVGAKIGSTILPASLQTNIPSLTSSRIMRGSRITPDEDCLLIGVHSARVAERIDIAYRYDTFRLFSATTPPTGTPLWEYTKPSTSFGTLPTSGASVSQLIFPPSAWVPLVGGETYRFVVYPNAAVPRPSRIAVVGYNNEWELVNAFLGGSIWTEESGGNWVDIQDAQCALQPILAPRRGRAPFVIVQ